MERGKIKRRRLAADAWRELVAKFADSGLTVQAFCKEQAISKSTFNWWRCRCNGGGGMQAAASNGSAAAAGQFVELGALKAVAPGSGERLELRLDLGGGMVLHLVRS